MEKSVRNNSAKIKDDRERNKIKNQKKVSFLQRLFSPKAKITDTVSSSLIDSKEADVQSTQAMLVNLRNLQKLRLEDIAVPKADIISISEDSALSEVVEVFRTSKFTRVPVYSDTLDNPLGLIHLKDFALSHGFGSANDFNLKAALRPLIYAPPSMVLGTLLQKMQTERIHMALVIDEYGGVEGLVTIEDLLEQIVGDIIDEHDVEEDQLWIEERPGVYLVHARLSLEDFADQAGVDLRNIEAEDEYDTIGGLVFSITNKIPIRGEVVRDSFENEYSVIDADPRSIKRLRLNLASLPKNNSK